MAKGSRGRGVLAGEARRAGSREGRNFCRSIEDEVRGRESERMF